MLWYKSWLETRSRFAIGLALAMCAAAGVVLLYRSFSELLQVVPPADVGGEIGRRIRESVELARDYRGYVWSQWFAHQLTQVWTLFAVLLGSGGLRTQSSRGGALFTLSLPVSRGHVVGVRAALALIELALLAVVPSLFVVVLSPAIGQSYSAWDALVHALCTFAAGSVFFSLAFALSTVWSDLWRPPLIALLVAAVLVIGEELVPDLARFSVFGAMGAEQYFRGGGLPWLGLGASAAVSAGLLYGAARNIARQDF